MYGSPMLVLQNELPRGQRPIVDGRRSPQEIYININKYYI